MSFILMCNYLISKAFTFNTTVKPWVLHFNWGKQHHLNIEGKRRESLKRRAKVWVARSELSKSWVAKQWSNSSTKLLNCSTTAPLSRVTGAFQIQVVQYTHDSSQSELSMAFMVVKVWGTVFFNTSCLCFVPLLILLIPLSVMKKSMIVSIFIFLFVYYKPYFCNSQNH